MSETSPAVELMTVRLPHGSPTLAAAAKHLGIAVEDLDAQFGVVPIDPDRGLYAVQVHAGKLPKSSEGSSEGYRGPWSNPRIEPFGPVQGGKPADKK
jgi:hypothetical protein